MKEKYDSIFKKYLYITGVIALIILLLPTIIMILGAAFKILAILIPIAIIVVSAIALIVAISLLIDKATVYFSNKKTNRLKEKLKQYDTIYKE